MCDFFVIFNPVLQWRLITEWDEIYGVQIMVDLGLSNRKWLRSLTFSFDAS